MIIKPLKIGKVKLKNNLILAPMAGYTDAGFRLVAKKYGAGLTVTDLICAKAIAKNDKKTSAMLQKSAEEKPSCLQLFGGDAEVFRQALSSPLVKNFDILDINMGCPAKKVLKNKEGSALMLDQERAKKIIETCVQNFDGPVTVKFRSGFYKNEILAVGFAKMCEEAGASAITLHARTTEQGFSGAADWTLFGKVKQAVNIPLIANGDIKDFKDVEHIAKNYLVDGFMIGQKAIGNPKIFEDIINESKGKSIREQSNSEKIADIKFQMTELKKYFSVQYVINKMKPQILNYFKKESSEIKLAIARAKSEEEMLKCIENIK